MKTPIRLQKEEKMKKGKKKLGPEIDLFANDLAFWTWKRAKGIGKKYWKS